MSEKIYFPRYTIKINTRKAYEYIENTLTKMFSKKRQLQPRNCKSLFDSIQRPIDPSIQSVF